MDQEEIGLSSMAHLLRGQFFMTRGIVNMDRIFHLLGS